MSTTRPQQAPPAHKIYRHLLRKEARNQADQAWALDATYMAMSGSFAYLAAMLDMASLMALSHIVAKTLEAWQVK